MKARIEEILSRIMSEKHDAKITIKFVKENVSNDNNDKSKTINK